MSKESEGTHGEILARIDERTKNHTAALKALCYKMETKYTTNDRFDPVQKIVYGLLGSAVLGILSVAASHIFG